MHRIKLIKKFFKKKTGNLDVEVTDIINADIENAIFRAKSLLLEDEMSEPLVLRAPNFENDKLKYRLHHDRDNNVFEVNYSDSLLSILFLGKDRLFYYQTEIDHVTGKFHLEETGNIKYEDVLNIEVKIDNEISNKNMPLHSEVNLQLRLKNNSLLEFNLRNHYSFNEEAYPAVLTEDEAYIVKTIKDAIRTI